MRRFAVGMLCAMVIAGCQLSRRLGPIQLLPFATFGASSGPGVLSSGPVVSPPLPDGDRVLIPHGSGSVTLPLVYSAGGRYVGTLVGGSDTATNFQHPVFARLGPGDSLWVFDAANRVLVFDASRRYVRTVTLPIAPWDAVILRDGRLLVTSADAGAPLPAFLIDRNGHTVRLIGGADPTAADIKAPRNVVLGPDGTVWTVPTAFRWRLEHWDTTGTLIKVLQDPAPRWFTPYDNFQSGSPRQAPSSQLLNAWFDAAGRLWVVGRRADPHWYRGFSGAHQTADDAVAVITDPDRAYDTMLQVIDPSTGRELAETRLDASYTSVVEPGVLVHVQTASSGWKTAQLVRINFDSARVQHLAQGATTN